MGIQFTCVRQTAKLASANTVLYYIMNLEKLVFLKKQGYTNPFYDVHKKNRFLQLLGKNYDNNEYT